MTNTIRILERAAELVEQGWTQRTTARTASGNQCDSASPFACKWCAVGAIERAGCESRYSRTDKAVALVRDAVEPSAFPFQFLSEWNDERGRTQAEVVAAFRRAIELAKEEAAA